MVKNLDMYHIVNFYSSVGNDFVPIIIICKKIDFFGFLYVYIQFRYIFHHDRLYLDNLIFIDIVKIKSWSSIDNLIIS